ncbi:holo-ACP synthase [Ferruginibacter sp. SUN002]|uniref:holo-ACP synthase n=1 Tax=Ferruginibacter sp. SUN002 TaxID=2937789 RepID=UPI003D363C5D
MEEKIKSIVAVYTKIPAENISNQTVIDRTAVASSIILHRMYGNLRNEGIPVENYWDIKTFGDLLKQLNGADNIVVSEYTEADSNANIQDEAILVGSDIEEVKNMPVVNDFREDEFYTMNFTSTEIAYAILQPNPFATFAGLFAAKEAIIKADNTYRNKKFNSIFIDHLPSGKPVHPEFSLSISHTNELAMATAIKVNLSTVSSQAALNPSVEKKSSNNKLLIYVLLFLAGALTATLLMLINSKK